MLHIRNLFVVLALVGGNIVFAANMHAPVTLEEARHLLGRTGFGASPYALNKIIGQTKQDAVNTIVGGLAKVPGTPAPEWTTHPAPMHWARNQLVGDKRQDFNQTRAREIESLRLWWINEMIQTSAPQAERLTLFWHNHFATSITGINDQAISIARQHMMFRKLGSGNFRTLLRAIIRDPAMLNYLDNDNSRKQAPNENLAREIMELFTLGEGNYTEHDIKNSAKALTGYSTAPGRNLLFQFKPASHDKTTKTIFGQRGNFNGDDVIDLILQQPAAAEFVTKKFWKMLVGEQSPNREQLAHVANRFRASDYDIKTLYRAILESDAFWHYSNRANIVRSPIDLTIGTIRSTGIVPDTWQLIPNITAQLGQHLFDPPNVAGWPGGRAWVTPSRLLNRLEWLRSLDQTCSGVACSSRGITAMSGMSNMTMQTMPPNSMSMQTATDASANPSPDELVIRMASEEINGPVEYRVTLSLGDMIVWSSDVTALSGGYDTKRYGKRPAKKSLPWQNISFKLPAIAHNFNIIEIEYLNDINKPGGARNLFIDWVSFGNRYYLADDAKQINSCKNRKRSRAGTMLCNGKLRLTKPVKHAAAKTVSTATQSGVQQGTDDIFTVGDVFLWGVRDPDRGAKKFTSVVYTLSDVQLGARHWHSITVTYGYVKKTNQYSLRLNSYGCWPDCVKQWPPCSALSKDESKTRTLAISVQNRDKQCQYRKLNGEDKKLVNSLFKNLPRFYDIAKSNKKLNRDKPKRFYDGWLQHVNTMNDHYTGSQTTDRQTDAVDFQLGYSSVTQQSMRTMQTFEPPLPAGRNRSQRQADMQQLLATNNEVTLGSLLLPGQTGIRKHANTAPHEILESLAFQLK